MSEAAEAVTEDVTEQATEQTTEQVTEQAAERPTEKSTEFDWRSTLNDENLKKQAERFNSVEDILRANLDFRKRESQVRVPGKDASEEEVNKYREAIGIPKTADDYELPVPKDAPEEIQEEMKVWGETFHKLNMSQDQVSGLFETLNTINEEQQKRDSEANEAFAKATEDALKAEWRGDYDKNLRLANQAFAKVAANTGLSIEDLQTKKLDNGRFLMDDPNMIKIFATLGREMSEGTIGPALSETEMETLGEEIEGVRKAITEAQVAGDSAKANKLYQKEQALLAKLSGNQPVVGAGGRSV